MHSESGNQEVVDFGSPTLGDIPIADECYYCDADDFVSGTNNPSIIASPTNHSDHSSQQPLIFDPSRINTPKSFNRTQFPAAQAETFDDDEMHLGEGPAADDSHDTHTAAVINARISMSMAKHSFEGPPVMVTQQIPNSSFAGSKPVAQPQSQIAKSYHELTKLPEQYEPQHTAFHYAQALHASLISNETSRVPAAGVGDSAPSVPAEYTVQQLNQSDTSLFSCASCRRQIIMNYFNVLRHTAPSLDKDENNTYPGPIRYCNTAKVAVASDRASEPDSAVANPIDIWHNEIANSEKTTYASSNLTFFKRRRKICFSNTKHHSTTHKGRSVTMALKCMDNKLFSIFYPGFFPVEAPSYSKNSSTIVSLTVSEPIERIASIYKGPSAVASAYCYPLLQNGNASLGSSQFKKAGRGYSWSSFAHSVLTESSFTSWGTSEPFVLIGEKETEGSPRDSVPRHSNPNLGLSCAGDPLFWNSPQHVFSVVPQLRKCSLGYFLFSPTLPPVTMQGSKHANYCAGFMARRGLPLAKMEEPNLLEEDCCAISSLTMSSDYSAFSNKDRLLKELNSIRLYKKQIRDIERLQYAKCHTKQPLAQIAPKRLLRALPARNQIQFALPRDQPRLVWGWLANLATLCDAAVSSCDDGQEALEGWRDGPELPLCRSCASGAMFAQQQCSADLYSKMDKLCRHAQDLSTYNSQLAFILTGVMEDPEPDNDAAADEEIKRLTLELQTLCIDYNEQLNDLERSISKRNTLLQQNARLALDESKSRYCLAEHNEKEYLSLKRSLLSRVYDINVESPVSMINGLRVGRYGENKVPDEEINAGCGFLLSLVKTLAERRNAKFSRKLELVVEGSQSRIIELMPSGKKTYEFFITHRFFAWRNSFADGWRAYISCVADIIAVYEALAKPIRASGVKVPTLPTLQISEDEVGGHSICYGSTSDESWSFAVRHIMILLRWCILADDFFPAI